MLNWADGLIWLRGYNKKWKDGGGEPDWGFSGKEMKKEEARKEEQMEGNLRGRSDRVEEGGSVSAFQPVSASRIMLRTDTQIHTHTHTHTRARCGSARINQAFDVCMIFGVTAGASHSPSLALVPIVFPQIMCLSNLIPTESEITEPRSPWGYLPGYHTLYVLAFNIISSEVKKKKRVFTIAVSYVIQTA